MSALKVLSISFAWLSNADRVLYEPTWESLDSRPTPAWWQAQKFSLFMHWGLYAVPAYCPVKASDKTCYAEHFWDKNHDNTSEQHAYMKSHYGEHFEYQDFAPLFRCENWEPKEWAALFKVSGAQGLTMTSKHHEGWALWPSAQHPNWNAVDTSPHRDLLQELGDAVRDEGMRFGFYYSLMQWDRAYTDDTGTEEQRGDGDRYVNGTMLPDLRDLVERYKPDVLYVDGEWSYDSDHWRTKPFLAWLFNDSPVWDKVAVNDRWGNDCRGKHGGFYVCEYGGEVDGSCISDNPTHPWTSHEGMGKSFGYNAIDEYKPGSYFVSLLVQSVAFGGNLQLNVGPTADGRVPQVQADILEQMGRWLAVNGESIYNTTGHPFGIEHGCTNSTGVGSTGVFRQCYTKSVAIGDIYIATTGLPLSIELPPGALQSPLPKPEAVSLLGAEPSAVGTFSVSVRDNATVIGVPTIAISALPPVDLESSCFVFKIKAAAAAAIVV